MTSVSSSTHVELAKVEIKEEVTQAGKGAGMLSGAALGGIPDHHVAVVRGGVGPLGGRARRRRVPHRRPRVGRRDHGLAISGRKELQQVKPVPPQTKETIQEDVQWAKQQTS